MSDVLGRYNPPYRSWLFVPGNVERFLRSAQDSDADAVVYDLEDSVPDSEKEDARRALVSLVDYDKPLVVRINAPDTDDLVEDIKATAKSRAEAILVPKLAERSDVVRVIECMERSGRMMPVIASLETAKSIWDPYTLLEGFMPVQAIMAGAPRGADVAQAIGFRWTAEGRERAAIEANAVIAGRALGYETIIAFPWMDVRETEASRKDGERLADLGYTSRATIHPNHVRSINDEFGVSANLLEEAMGIVAAMEEAIGHNRASTRFRDQMIDIAHMHRAQAVIRRARALERLGGAS